MLLALRRRLEAPTFGASLREDAFVGFRNYMSSPPTICYKRLPEILY